MGQNLVIVESPAKAKTIEKILGKDFLVKSSFGHIRDLAKRDLAIDIENGFTPLYEVSDDKKKLVAELKSLAAKSDVVWLASDEDREGEAIAWHLYNVLELQPEKTKRIVFHEITKSAILHAIENPRGIDMNVVNAQQARRVLDRLVGFELSPILWRKIKPSLSAGRVQSVAVRLIAEREKEIQNFVIGNYFRVVADFQVDNHGREQQFKADLNTKLEDKNQASELLAMCAKSKFTVSNIEQKPAKRSPAPPFTTSTLQQEASRKLGMSVSQVMSVAQRLYEAGMITYMRTDSVNLSMQAIGAIKEQITEKFGEKYVHVRNYKTKSKGAQEAHEAIRPTYIDKQSVELGVQEKRLYDLIWKRTVASQMADAALEKTTAEIAISETTNHYFVANGEIVKFDGFLKLYSESREDDAADENSGMLPQLSVGQSLKDLQIIAVQKFTSANARYSEASLVKKLEDLGIGRPSTYAPTISTIINRGYVVKESRDGKSRGYVQLVLSAGVVTENMLKENYGSEKNKLFPTDVGLIVTDYLEEHFPDILDYNFTAKVEKEFDEIADGNIIWNDMIESFYGKFHDDVNEALEDSTRKSTTRELGVDPKSGKAVYAKIGRFGPYVQLGENEDDAGVKPQYANIGSGLLIATITLEDAMKLFEIPRNVGQFEDKDMIVGIGKFGPYVRHDSKFISLKKTDNPYTITAERAIELIEEKRVQDSQKHIKSFAEDAEMQLLRGRWGAYISYKGDNYKFPKDIDPESVDFATCMSIVKNQEPSSARKGRFSKSKEKAAVASEKKAATKAATKAAAKKAPAKKVTTKKVATKKVTTSKAATVKKKTTK